MFRLHQCVLQFLVLRLTLETNRDKSPPLGLIFPWSCHLCYHRRPWNMDHRLIRTIHMRYVFHVNIKWSSFILYNFRCESYTLLAHLSNLNTTVLCSSFMSESIWNLVLRSRLGHCEHDANWNVRGLYAFMSLSKILFLKNPLSYLHFYKDLHNFKKMCIWTLISMLLLFDRSKDSKMQIFFVFQKKLLSFSAFVWTFPNLWSREIMCVWR